jgi:hypothetical protein
MTVIPRYLKVIASLQNFSSAKYETEMAEELLE